MLKGEQMMRILVDADACPVIGIVESTWDSGDAAMRYESCAEV